MANPYAFLTGLPLGGSQGSSNVGAMAIGHNINLSGLGGVGPFTALNFQGNGQGMPGLPFSLQPGNTALLQNQLGMGLGGMLPGQRPPAPIPSQSHSEYAARGGPQAQQQDQEILVSKSKENDKQLVGGSSRGRDRTQNRKRARSNSNADSDNDIMVLSNSPSSSETGDRREGSNTQTKSWEGPSVLGLANGSMSYSMPNQSLVNGSLGFPGDPTSLMAAMGSQIGQMPYDFGLMPGVLSNVQNTGKEAIHLKSCSLFPPNPQAPPPTTRDRPMGCRTVFVGGLPENTTEEILKEIFERCGEIATIRMSKKNFAHVRFERECYVDNAINLSGYRVRLNNQKTDGGGVNGSTSSSSGSNGGLGGGSGGAAGPANSNGGGGSTGSSANNSGSGRLHVDFAQARDDQYEFECQQRRLEREMRHRQRIEEEKWRPPSPPPVPHYAEHEAHVVVEQLKSEERYGRAVQILATWLERGDCSKRNSNGFYSMIQSAHAHLRRLGSEKSQLEDEAKRTHDTLRQKFLNLTTQLGEMQRLFQAASHQKAWDHFTKAQRKSLESWKKHVMDLKSGPTVDFLMASCKGDDNMDLSDSESDEPHRYKSDAHEKNIANLKEENDSLRCQLEAYKNEVEIVRSDLKSELQLKDQQIKIMSESMKSLERRVHQQQTASTSADAAAAAAVSQSANAAADTRPMGDSNARLVSLISIYLSVHRLGTCLDKITDFVHQSDAGSPVTAADVDRILNANPDLFARISGVDGAATWRFKLFF